MEPDTVTQFRRAAKVNSFWQFLGIEVEDAGEGWVRLRLPVRDEIRNARGGRVHGGVCAALVDAAVGGALMTMPSNSASGGGQATLDLNVSYLGAVAGGCLHAEGRVLRRGSSVGFGDVTITDDDGRMVAVGRATYLVARGSLADRSG
jgi:acyl-CoA thioesterase